MSNANKLVVISTDSGSTNCDRTNPRAYVLVKSRPDSGKGNNENFIKYNGNVIMRKSRRGRKQRYGTLTVIWGSINLFLEKFTFLLVWDHVWIVINLTVSSHVFFERKKLVYISRDTRKTNIFYLSCGIFIKLHRKKTGSYQSIYWNWHILFFVSEWGVANSSCSTAVSWKWLL